MSKAVRMQSPASYSGQKYGSGTIGSSGCGPAALVNALLFAGIADVSVPTMCNYAVSVGARVDGGTVMVTLLDAASKKYGFTYVKTSLNADLLAHLKKGYTAILYNGNIYPFFTTGGHYTTATGLSGSNIVVADPLYYTNKWSVLVNGKARRKWFAKCGTDGIVHASIDVIGKSTQGKNPSYFLIYPKTTPTDTTKNTVTSETTTEKEEEDNMKYYKNLTDIPSYYKNAIQKLVDSGAMAGTGNGELNVSEDLCRMATVLNNAGILDLTTPVVYKTIDDVPTYYRNAVQKMIDRGAISGTGNGELNLGADICRALTILDNAGLLEVCTCGSATMSKEVGSVC